MKPSLESLVLRNWGLKLFALAAALVLWLIFIPEEKIVSEKTLTIRLETLNRPPNMELVQKPPPTIDITVRAPNRILDEITPTNVSAGLDLSAASIAQQEYPLNRDMISLPPGAEVIRISPNQVQLKLERTKRIELEIEPDIRGEQALVDAGFNIINTEVRPPTVLVSGPESLVQSGDKVSTAPVDVSDLQQSTFFEVDLILPKPDLQLAEARTKVQVRIIIQEIKEENRNPNPKRK